MKPGIDDHPPFIERQVFLAHIERRSHETIGAVTTKQVAAFESSLTGLPEVADRQIYLAGVLDNADRLVRQKNVDIGAKPDRVPQDLL